MKLSVAPFVGAWIEIKNEVTAETAVLSLRSSERGLKFMHLLDFEKRQEVAPFVGAWIEIGYAGTL